MLFINYSFYYIYLFHCLFILYYFHFNSLRLSYSDFIIFIIIIFYHILYIPRPLLSLSFIILILVFLYPLSSSFTTLVLYHPPLLSASLLISSFILYTPLMRINLISIAIVQDVSDRYAAAGIEPGTFSPDIFWRVRARGRANSRKDPPNKNIAQNRTTNISKNIPLKNSFIFHAFAKKAKFSAKKSQLPGFFCQNGKKINNILLISPVELYKYLSGDYLHYSISSFVFIFCFSNMLRVVEKYKKINIKRNICIYIYIDICFISKFHNFN